MRSANKLFDDEERFATLLPRIRSKTPELAAMPLGQTENVAYDWLQHGGKRFRPFITLAAYDAMTGGASLAAGANGEETSIPDGVGRVAMAIEAFHKASLVHDDIEDADLYRYGRKTLHRTHGVGPAINIGDHLIGIGYKLVAAARSDIGAEAAADILDRMANAHVRLCDGQGAEMAWQASPDFSLTPLDALQIYALKTSPAFEAALYAGIRMAGVADGLEEMIPQFARHVGVGFQILNDLKDWRGDEDNKLVAGQDALALRPTVLLALALQTASAEQQATLRTAFSDQEPTAVRLGRLRRVFNELQAFDKAEALVEKSRDRAEQLADTVENEDLRRLLYFFIDTVLAEQDAPSAPPKVLVELPVTAGA
jgi:geranylgeranyl pyrophosphate synthase